MSPMERHSMQDHPRYLAVARRALTSASATASPGHRLHSPSSPSPEAGRDFACRAGADLPCWRTRRLCRNHHFATEIVDVGTGLADQATATDAANGSPAAANPKDCSNRGPVAAGGSLPYRRGPAECRAAHDRGQIRSRARWRLLLRRMWRCPCPVHCSRGRSPTLAFGR